MSPDWSIGEDERMAEYRQESRWDMPMSDRERSPMSCPECDKVYWPEDGDTCLECQDAYLDAMESRFDHYHGGNDDE